jgi:hypothetical protein
MPENQMSKDPSDQQKRSIDRKRDSAGSMEVGLPEEGSITEIYAIGDERLLMIKERATYEISFADRIDPERTNNAIPNVQQRVLQAGSDHELVQRVLLTSQKLFDATYLPDLDWRALREHALNALRELLAMERIFLRLSEEQDGLLGRLEGQTLKNGFIVPSMSDLEQEAKNFLQRSDHFTRELFRIVRIFEPGFGNMDNLIKRAKRERPINETFVEFLQRAIPFISFVREARNAVEHPSAQKRVIVRDFELNREGKLMPPSIELSLPKRSEPRTNLVIFLREMIRSLASMYGEMIANLCARKASVGAFGVAIARLPEAKRQYKWQEYAYAINFNGEWQQIG